MNKRSCWGIFRERAHSPGRESDDAEILRLTGKQLEAKGFEVSLRTPDELQGADDDRPAFIFLMCEGADVLSRLRALEGAGVLQVNRPLAVLNTYRGRMIVQLEEANVPFIGSRIVSTTGVDGHERLPVWVKRADVHNTQEGDVTFAPTPSAVSDALRGLAERGILHAVIQPHLEGDLVKFYGIGTGSGPGGGPPWFRSFYHKQQRLAGYPFDPASLARLVRRAATALGLEIYGGDAIVTAGGDVVLLDLNAWPSFALYRDEAAERAASYLSLRFTGESR